MKCFLGKGILIGMHVVKKLMGSVREYKRHSLLAPLFVTFEVVLEVLIPLLMVRLIDEGIDAGDMGAILQVGGILVVCCLISLVCGALSGHYAASASSGFAKNLRKDIKSSVFRSNATAICCSANLSRYSEIPM